MHAAETWARHAQVFFDARHQDAGGTHLFSAWEKPPTVMLVPHQWHMTCPLCCCRQNCFLQQSNHQLQEDQQKLAQEKASSCNSWHLQVARLLIHDRIDVKSKAMKFLTRFAWPPIRIGL